MKRRIGLGIALCALAACGSQPSAEQQAAVAEKAWVTPPVIEAAAITSGSLTISGTASPTARVVVSDPGGQQFAVAADARGDFRLVMPRPAREALYRVEVQAGQTRYLAPGRLFVPSAPGGPIAFVSAGAATRRFDPGPVLDAVDSDGRTIILSGRAAAGSMARVEAGVVRQIAPDASGRWTAAPPGSPAVVRVNGETFEPIVSMAGPDGFTEAPGGWRLIWSGPDGSRQVTWFPSRVVETAG